MLKQIFGAIEISVVSRFRAQILIRGITTPADKRHNLDHVTPDFLAIGVWASGGRSAATLRDFRNLSTAMEIRNR
jgi:hypothetical protein